MEMRDTRSRRYADRLLRVQGASWKRYAPNPYRRWLRSLDLGFTLDVGCGLGRTLMYLDGNGVGVDHNKHSVEICRDRGLTCFTPDEFGESVHAVPGRFDALTCLHVLEHIPAGEAVAVLRDYLPYVRPGGRVVLVTPQERGYRSDDTHTQFVSGVDLCRMSIQLGLEPSPWRSFPLPRWAGGIFIYNEFHLVARVSALVP